MTAPMTDKAVERALVLVGLAAAAYVTAATIGNQARAWLELVRYALEAAGAGLR